MASKHFCDLVEFMHQGSSSFFCERVVLGVVDLCALPFYIYTLVVDTWNAKQKGPTPQINVTVKHTCTVCMQMYSRLSATLLHIIYGLYCVYVCMYH